MVGQERKDGKSVTHCRVNLTCGFDCGIRTMMDHWVRRCDTRLLVPNVELRFVCGCKETEQGGRLPFNPACACVEQDPRRSESGGKDTVGLGSQCVADAVRLTHALKDLTPQVLTARILQNLMAVKEDTFRTDPRVYFATAWS